MQAERIDDLKTSPLLERLKERIGQDGPISVHDYMELCLTDPEHGYYATRDPFGVTGDFITAPEISQVFGELIGLWCAVSWQQMGSPGQVHLAELGPGRGTLMADLLRAAASVPGFTDAIDVHLVETSPVLRGLQEDALKPSGLRVTWHTSVSEIPEGPAILVANEFLDALPIRQFNWRSGAWHEHLVGVDEAGRLAFTFTDEPYPDSSALPLLEQGIAQDGDILEMRPGVEALVATLAARDAPLAALFIDYGHAVSSTGDTLQAVRGHEASDALKAPGLSDLTAHVDFGDMALKAQEVGLTAHGPISQGAFLMALGLQERTQMLLEGASSDQMESLVSGSKRLAEPDKMGELFKVMALTKDTVTPPPFADESKGVQA